MPKDAPSLYITEPGNFALGLWFFRRAWMAALEDNVFGIAKGAAYSALLSFFPVLTTITALLVQAKAQAVSRVLTRWISEAAPPGTEDLLRNYIVLHGERPVTLLVSATLVSMWAASGVMSSLMEGFRAVYRVPSVRSLWKQRGVAAGLVLCAALPVVGASTLMLLGTRAEAAVIYWLGVVPQGAEFHGAVAVIGRTGRYLVAFGAIVSATALLYKLGPNRPMRVVWPGAFVATIMWLLGIMAFGWYVRHMAHYNVLYGSIGTVIALVVWMYVLSVVALFGCEFNAQVERWQTLRATTRVRH